METSLFQHKRKARFLSDKSSTRAFTSNMAIWNITKKIRQFQWRNHNLKIPTRSPLSLKKCLWCTKSSRTQSIPTRSWCLHSKQEVQLKTICLRVHTQVVKLPQLKMVTFESNSNSKFIVWSGFNLSVQIFNLPKSLKHKL